MAKPGSASNVSLEDRDPNNLNQHVQIVWDDIVGEPEGARSPECVWRVSSLAYRHARNCCYVLLSVVLGVPVAACLGCCFAGLAFEQIWCSAPCLRAFKICCGSTRALVRAALAATVVPAAEALGHVLAHVRVRRAGDDEQDVLVV